jgi:rod shape determining protein RodA
MQRVKTQGINVTTLIAMGGLISISLAVLYSISPDLFPLYFLYVILGAFAFLLFSSTDYEVISVFSKHLYVFSIFLLILPLIIGQITRGTVRWIPIGALTIQPAEIVRPFLIVFFADYVTSQTLNLERLIKGVALLALPLFLILIQPSLGVTILTSISFVGVLLASGIAKKYYAMGVAMFLLLLPVFWFLMKDYQRERITSFLDPASDPTGAGYNSIQSMISVGSGGFFGRGLGKGVQTQLAFLPEKQSDFIFAAVAEELGLVGATIVLILTAYLLIKLVKILENSRSPAARAFLAGFLLTMIAQVVVHVGMNMGLLPITGVPYPLVSAGGSSLLATMTGFGIALSCKRGKTS